MVPLIIDQDLNTDSEDATSISVAGWYHKAGMAQILGVMCDTTADGTLQCADALLTAAGVDTSSVLFGQLQGTTFNPGSTNDYATYTAARFSHPHTGSYTNQASSPDALTQYRTLLATRSKQDVVIACGGFMTNLANLLASSADGISSLTGAQLVAASVKAIYQQGGGLYPFVNSADYNMGFNSAAITAAQNAIAAIPTATQFIVSPGEVGTSIVAGDTLASVASSSALYTAANRSGNGAGRSSWDTLQVMASVEGAPDYKRCRGAISVNGSGVVSFTPSPTGHHYFLIKNLPDATMKARCNDLIVAGALGTGPSAWSSAGLVRIGT